MGVAYHMHFAHIVVTTLPFSIETVLHNMYTAQLLMYLIPKGRWEGAAGCPLPLKIATIHMHA